MNKIRLVAWCAAVTHHDRPERLLDGDEGAVLDVGKDGRLHVESGPVALLSAEEQSRALLHADLAVLDELLEVRPVILYKETHTLNFYALVLKSTIRKIQKGNVQSRENLPEDRAASPCPRGLRSP